MKEVASSTDVTYGQVVAVLEELGFTDVSVPESHKAFRHSDTDTIFAFSDRYSDDSKVTPTDLASLRKHLVEKRGVAEHEMPKWLQG